MTSTGTSPNDAGAARRIDALGEQVLDGRPIARSQAEGLLSSAGAAYDALLYQANRVRRHFKGDKIHLCSIVNARSGRCSQDCAFCAQSAHHNTGVATYPLLAGDEIVARGRTAMADGAHDFGVVLSGRGPDADEVERLVEVVERLVHEKISPCLSPGVIDRDAAIRLKRAGLKRFHHNLETGRNFYPQICSTHDYDRRIATLRNAAAAGLEICSGGIFGLGESDDDILDLAFLLRDFGPKSIPINFLNPVAGTPLGNRPLLAPRKALAIVALFRFVHPEADIKTAGGREIVLRDLQSWMFYAGANSTMIGNYLTTSGRDTALDLKMIEDLGLVPEKN